MQYVLNIYDDEKRRETTSEEESERILAAYMAYRKALQDAGVFVGSNRLKDTSSAATVRVGGDGKTQVLDGPYAETKEQLAGFFLIEVPDLDAAIGWAARCPGASMGAIEIRPVMPVPAVV